MTAAPSAASMLTLCDLPASLRSVLALLAASSPDGLTALVLAARAPVLQSVMARNGSRNKGGKKKGGKATSAGGKSADKPARQTSQVARRVISGRR
eukprot:755029-Hanusia_phi.AAC.21